MICNLLKMTNSIRTELIPWSANHVANKTFTWTVSHIDEDHLHFDFIFDHPLYISQDGKWDTIKITFLNTPFYLIPEDKSKTAIANGYGIAIKIPPQTVIEEIPVVNTDNAKTTLVTLMASNTWFAFLMGMSMQPLFDMINSL